MTTIIYHSADYDGIFCREIAKHFLGTLTMQYIGWNFGDPPIALPINGEFVVMDLPIDKPFGLSFKDGWLMRGDEKLQPLDRVDWGKFVWIDHHKSSIDYHPKEIQGHRIDGVAACRLAWQWFSENKIAERTGESPRLPEKRHYVERLVTEPLAVRLAGEYDVWDKRDPRADILQYGLRSAEGELSFSKLLNLEDTLWIDRLLEIGESAQRYAQKIDADLVMHRSFRLKWEGLDFLCLNTGRFNSLTFDALDKPETGHDALLGFMWNGKVWTVSLYHAKHRTDLDLSAIAVKHGGGGHRGACGFTCSKLPFLL